MNPADLDLDVDRMGICQACLCLVSPTSKSDARKMAPILWEEGLAQPALDAVRRLGDREALADLERNGGRSGTARAIVLYLAKQQEERARRWYQAMLN